MLEFEGLEDQNSNIGEESPISETKPPLLAIKAEEPEDSTLLFRRKNLKSQDQLCRTKGADVGNSQKLKLLRPSSTMAASSGQELIHEKFKLNKLHNKYIS